MSTRPHLTLTPDTYAHSPPCLRCSLPTTRLITRSSNRNGNGGRPYDKCLPCGKFHRFADSRGDHPDNPPCRCGGPSKRQVAGEQRGKKVHYVCRGGTCEFYAEQVPRRRAVVARVQEEEEELGWRLARLVL